MFTLKKGAMPIPELTSGVIIGDLVVLYILTPEVANEDRGEDMRKRAKTFGRNSIRDDRLLIPLVNFRLLVFGEKHDGAHFPLTGKS